MRPRVEHIVWDKIDVRGPRECWPWTGIKSHFGHGRFYRDPEHRQIQAHREVYRLVRFLEDDEMPPVVRHSCDNPPCCNPKHLLGGTKADNNHDAWTRGGLSKSLIPVEVVGRVRMMRAEGLSYQECADACGVNIGSAWAMVNRKGRYVKL